MSFSIEQCKADGWKCEVLVNEHWLNASLLASPVNTQSIYLTSKGIVTGERIRNLPPTPQEPTPTRLAINAGVGFEGRSVVFSSAFNTEPRFSEEYYRFTRIELPWPWTKEHQRWMDMFGTHGLVDVALEKGKLWTLVEEGWKFEDTERAWRLAKGRMFSFESNLSAAVNAAWAMRSKEQTK